MLNLPEGEDAITSKMEGTKKVVEQVNAQFKDPDMTTFVCVCIPEVRVTVGFKDWTCTDWSSSLVFVSV